MREYFLNLQSFADSSRSVKKIAAAEIKNVSASDTGMDQRTPFSPQMRGSSRAKPTPNTTSLTMDSAVDSSAFPKA